MPRTARNVLHGSQRWAALTSILVAALLLASPRVSAVVPGEPFAEAFAGRPISFPNDTDSSSPAVWDQADGVWTLSLFNSVAGLTQLSEGRGVQRLADVGQVAFSTAAPLGGYWFESVLRDTDAWYGFYHNEREGVVCDTPGKVLTRIGAARSEDHGRTWTDLGPIIEAPDDAATCETHNLYFVGGVGDFSAVLDADHNYIYLYYTQYVEQDGRVGVSAARLAWADRDAPRGRVDVWSDGVWLPPLAVPSAVPADDEGLPSSEPEWRFPLATPFLPSSDRWDDGNDTVDVFWGPSIHWNTHLECYVMLLNRANTFTFGQEGVYVSFNPRLDDPAGWSAPVRLLEGGRWYPQVLGLTEGEGTDKYAGQEARLFMSGRSEYTLRFGRR